MDGKMKVIAVLGKYFVPKRAGGVIIRDTSGRPIPDYNAMENNRRLAEILHMMVYHIPDADIGGFCAHMNTRRFELLTDAEEERFQKLDLVMIERACDAAILVPNWRNSYGTINEIAKFNSLGRPVFEELQSLRAWAMTPEGTKAGSHRMNIEDIDRRGVIIHWLANRSAKALTCDDLWNFHHLDRDCIPRPINHT
jgi:hypothetical protein